MKVKNSVSYIFPVYNEEKFLEKQIEEFLSQVTKFKLPLKNIILVENGSTDNSWKICQKLAKKNKKIIAKRIAVGSYGLAVKHGLLSSNSDTLVLLNVDFFDSNFLKQAIPFAQSYDVINGSKLHKESNDSRTLKEKLRTKIFNFILKLFNYPGTDTHGIKVLKNTPQLQECLNSVIAKHELFDTELLFRIAEYGKILELSIVITDLRPTRYTSITRTQRMLIDLSRILSFSLFSQTNTIKRITIADDYGIDEITSQAILDLFETNQIAVLSVLANMVSKNDLKKLKAKKIPNSRIAIHLNLVRGKPVTDNKKIPTLVDSNGMFFSLPKFIYKLLLKKININEVSLEFKNQITLLNKQGIFPKYLNSEQHTHAFSPISAVVSAILPGTSITHVRSTADILQYLSWRIHKYVVFSFVYLLLDKIYKNTNTLVESHHESIVHPGSNYD